MEKSYRALIREIGEILECETFKAVYYFAMRDAKDYLDSYDDVPVVLIEFDVVWYSDYTFINKYGYPQHDVVQRDHIAYVAISDNGYTIDYDGIVMDVDRNGRKSVQRGWKYDF